MSNIWRVQAALALLAVGVHLLAAGLHVGHALVHATQAAQLPLLSHTRKEHVLMIIRMSPGAFENRKCAVELPSASFTFTYLVNMSPTPNLFELQIAIEQKEKGQLLGDNYQVVKVQNDATCVSTSWLGRCVVVTPPVSRRT